MTKAVIYARVSSKEQEKEGFSIPAQFKFLEEYAECHGFEIVKAYSDAETAKKVGRTSFQAMLDDIRSDIAKVLIVEKVDRLTRNFFDLIPIKQLIHEKGLEIHLVKENEVFGPNTNTNAKFMFNIKVSMAEHYIDNLSDEIRKGIHEKAAQGWFPHQPPYGYKGQGGKIVIQPEKARFVERLFELYATGRYTFESIPQALYDEGLVHNPSKPKIPHQSVEKILKNPFYRGYFLYGGKQYDGKHERFISDELAERVDKVLKQRSHKHVDHEYLFQGLITCAYCGCQVVGDRKKAKYTYYTCCNSRKICKRQYVREEVINEVVESVLSTIQPSE